LRKLFHIYLEVIYADFQHFFREQKKWMAMASMEIGIPGLNVSQTAEQPSGLKAI
jgi:hypothetical protein